MPRSDRRDAASTTVRTQLQLRELILAGELKPDERISEQSIVERIGASRTPVRTALIRLEEEGFLKPIPSGGYAVRSFTEADIFDAIEVRGTIEGLGARLAAERGPGPRELSALRGVADRIDGVIDGLEPMTKEHFVRYAKFNAQFHDALRDLCGSEVVARQIDRVNAYPFASNSGLVLAQSVVPEARSILTVGQYHHRSLIEALSLGHGSRAEEIAREHARLAARNLAYALRDQRARQLVPGASLISGSALP